MMFKIATMALALTLLSGCAAADAPAEHENITQGEAVETGFDEQLTDAEANAALDALDSEDAVAAEQ